ncbi:MAG: hypothetical protein NC548_38600 [Lachnospiraceae bacterium]|nr:hypothetical protein [Lachnospiraceae bacterium]
MLNRKYDSFIKIGALCGFLLLTGCGTDRLAGHRNQAIEETDSGIQLEENNVASGAEEKSGFDQTMHGEILGSGECGADGDNVKWIQYEDGVLYIYGEGDLADEPEWLFQVGGVLWPASSSEIYIDNGITGIGTETFSDISMPRCIIIPESVSSIGKNAILDHGGQLVIYSASVCAETYANENGISFIHMDPKSKAVQYAFAADIREYTDHSNTYWYPIQTICAAVKENNGKLMTYVFGEETIAYFVEQGEYNDLTEECQDACGDLYESFSESYGTDFDVAYKFQEIRRCEQSEIEELNLMLQTEYSWKDRVEEAYEAEIVIIGLAPIMEMNQYRSRSYEEMGPFVIAKTNNHWYILPE